MKKLGVLLIVTGLVFAACGDSDSASSCEDLADDGIALVQDMLDELSDLSLEDISSDEEPQALQDFTEKGEALQTQADELGCTDEQMTELVSARVGSLDADGPIAELILEGLQSEGGDLFGG